MLGDPSFPMPYFFGTKLLFSGGSRSAHAAAAKRQGAQPQEQQPGTRALTRCGVQLRDQAERWHHTAARADSVQAGG